MSHQEACLQSLHEACFKRLADKDYFRNQEFTDFVDDIIHFYCISNMLHPFRQGNGVNDNLIAIFTNAIIPQTNEDDD